MKISNNKKIAQIISWLGFGISLLCFVTIWCINFAMIARMKEIYHTGPAMFMASISCAIILGMTGLILSVGGFVVSKLNSSNKIPSLMGILLCVASFLSIIFPVFYKEMFIKTETLEIILPPHIPDNTVTENSEIILYLEESGIVKCYMEEDDESYEMSALSAEEFYQGFKTWMETSDYDENKTIVIKSDKDAHFSHLGNILDALHDLKIKNFSIQ